MFCSPFHTHKKIWAGIYKHTNKAHSNHKAGAHFRHFRCLNWKYELKKIYNTNVNTVKKKIARNIKFRNVTNTFIFFFFFRERRLLVKTRSFWGYLAARVRTKGWALHVNFPRFPPSMDRPYRLFCPAYAV